MSWDERYLRGDHADLAPLPFLVELAERLPGPGRVLDLACGAGRHAILFAERGWTVTAVDSSAVALRLLAEREVRTVQADLESWEIEPGSWDLAIVSFYLQHSLFDRLRESAIPGCRVAIAIPLVDGREGVRAMNPAYLLEGVADLVAEFPGWDVEHCAEVEPEAPGRRRAEFVAVLR
jgi:SAM-dependent methyltransferase